MGYVDIHSHVLYGIDDGARTREQSVEMLQLAAQSGTSDIVATPHANGQYAFDPEIVEERIAELSARTKLRIYPGCDFHLQFDNIEDALTHPEKYTINHKGYLLVEFPDVGVFTETDAILARLLDGGMVPIVTHPERNRELQRRVDDLARWVANGCYVQVTAGSFEGTFGKAAQPVCERADGTRADALCRQRRARHAIQDAEPAGGLQPARGQVGRGPDSAALRGEPEGGADGGHDRFRASANRDQATEVVSVLVSCESGR